MRLLTEVPLVGPRFFFRALVWVLYDSGFLSVLVAGPRRTRRAIRWSAGNKTRLSGAVGAICLGWYALKATGIPDIVEGR